MKRADGHYPVYWPELAETSKDYEMRVPAWDRLEAQAIATRARLRENDIQTIQIDVPDRRQFGTIESPYPLDRFDLRNVFCFQHLPDIIDIKQQAALSIAVLAQLEGAPRQDYRRDTPQARAARAKMAQESFTGTVRIPVDALGNPVEPPDDALKRKIGDMAEQVRAEFAHSLYHHAMWRHHGRHVYVLDRTTYQLLANTPLPDFPVSMLTAPHHSFYLVLPPEAFEFSVWNTRTQTIDRQPIEGAYVALDNIAPDSPHQRELAFMAIGQGGDVTDRNIAFISMALGADARLSEVDITGGTVPSPLGGTYNRENWRAGENGGRDLGLVLPRVILSLLLYLADGHPDIEPVPPATRRTFSDIRSPKQRAAALANQAAKLKGTTRLPIHYVGRHLAAEIAAERTRVEQAIAHDAGRTWTLDRPVWVSGHWRQQPHGPGRALRKIIWIRPYQKGPDMAASLTVHAAKVQRAQHADHG